MLCSLLFRLSQQCWFMELLFSSYSSVLHSNTHVQMEEMDHGSLGANALIADGSLTIKGSLGLGVKLVPSEF